jgi:NAD(P)-dependent dehydrogenase (short-subunit alcohol dehydrogenase family)
VTDISLLRGRRALVTGGGRGIGRATALMLAQSGADVFVTARTEPEIEAVATKIRDAGGTATALPADVGEPTAVRSLFERIGPVDILINNAGIIGPIAPLAEADPEEWLRTIRIDLDGVFLACRLVLPGMLQRGWGRIVNVSSGAARGSTAAWSAYSAAKAGVEAMTRVLGVEVAGTGVCVNAMRPGVVDTEMQVEIRSAPEERFGTDNLNRFRGYKERGVLRPPEEPARLILWLLSSAADDINGDVLAIDDPEVSARIGLAPRSR